MSKTYTPDSAAQDVEAALRLLEGRWKLVILFHLFGGKILRFSDLERVIPNITQKMLGQQLRRMESDGIVVRKVYPQVPPKLLLDPALHYDTVESLNKSKKKGMQTH